jgi:hypothetical protein
LVTNYTFKAKLIDYEGNLIDNSFDNLINIIEPVSIDIYKANYMTVSERTNITL